MRENFDERLQRAWGPGTPDGPIRRLLSSDREDGAPPANPLAAMSYEDASGAVTVVLNGELDMASAAAVERQLRNAEGEPIVLLDLRRLSFIDSSGLHMITDAEARIRENGGRLVVVRPPKHVYRVFQLAGLDRRLEVVDGPPVGARGPVDEPTGGDSAA